MIIVQTENIMEKEQFNKLPMGSQTKELYTLILLTKMDITPLHEALPCFKIETNKDRS